MNIAPYINSVGQGSGWFQAVDDWYFSIPYSTRVGWLGVVFVVGMLIYAIIVEGRPR